jgi:Domain of unknown function (DUF3883)
MALLELNAKLREFDTKFDTSFEDQAAQTRGAFLRAFPLNRLKTLTLDDYVIGGGRPSFCAYVEAKTKPWANILGATSSKFGIYFGRTKSDPRNRYRFTKKYGDDERGAFSAVKGALLELIDAGQSKRFAEVDENPLSQMFKAKILSLYFPDTYLNVCSGDHIAALAAGLDISDEAFVSELQHRLLQEKLRNTITKNWSNPKFMTFLYNTFIRASDEQEHVKAPRRWTHPEINVDDLLENRKKIGEKSEAFAWKWEKERLIGRGYKALIKKMQDRRDAPSCGYDFLSHTAPNRKRFIEVKSAGKNRASAGFRFFLSETQHTISHNSGDDYFFYLVFYDKDGDPVEVKPYKADEMYDMCDLGPNGYVVTFDPDDSE